MKKRSCNEEIQPNFSAQGIKSAAKKLDVLFLIDEDRKAYERYEENAHYEASMHESHYGRGKLEGREEVIHLVTRNLKNIGMPFEKISEATGLSVDKIPRL